MGKKHLCYSLPLGHRERRLVIEEQLSGGGPDSSPTTLNRAAGGSGQDTGET